MREAEGMGGTARVLAAVIALSAIAGIVIEFRGSLARGLPAAGTAWLLVAYFTIITNGLMAILFGSIALGSNALARPRLLAGAALAMALVGIIFALLLSGLRVLEGAALLADFLLHRSNPVLVTVFWLAFAPKGRLVLRDTLAWTAYPLAYFAYALVRGGATGFYPYPFLDIAQRGWAAVAVTALVIAILFVASGAALVWLDGRLGRPRTA
jgi:hypothetical protein